MIFPGKSKGDPQRAIIVSTENGKEHHAKNINGKCVYQYKIDGDIDKSSTESLRCDYALEIEAEHKLYLIELKGNHVLHAIKQIDNTIKRYSSQFRGYAIFPRVICSHSNTTAMKDSFTVAFKRNYPKTVIKTNCKYEENV